MIYFLKRTDGHVKIGYSGNYYQRYGQLKGEHGDLILLGWRLGDMAEEKRLHIRFSEYKVEKEWYRHMEDLADYIEDETMHDPPPRHERSQAKAMTLDDYLEEQIAEALKDERAQNHALAEQIATDRIEIIKLQAQVEILEKLALKLQDHAIEAAFNYIKGEKERQLKIVS